MERRTKQAGVKRKSRKSLWISLVAVAVVIALLVMEQVAVLYVLATLSVVALLIIVAWADLGESRRAKDAGVAPHDDAAAIADGLTSPSTTFGRTTSSRGVKRG